jgi:hypothetical protein
VRRLIPLVVLLLGLVFGFLGTARPEQGPSIPDPIAVLIADLGHEDFETREAATQCLRVRLDAVPALRAALRSPDPEVKRRVTFLLEELRDLPYRQVRRWLAEGRLDLAGEAFAVRNWEKEEVIWQLFFKATQEVLERFAEVFDEPVYAMAKPNGSFPVADLHRWVAHGGPYRVHTPTAPHPKFTNAQTPGRFLARGEELGCGRLFESFALSAGGNFDNKISVCNTSVWANAPFRTEGGLLGSLVICDGDCRMSEAVGSFLVANGNVVQTSYRPFRACRIIATGKVIGEVGLFSLVQENNPTPLGFIRFFNPSDHGISVEPATEAVRVKDLSADKPFAQAGLQVGDLVTALGDRATDSPEAFRRALRRRIAEGNDIAFKVRRSDRNLGITVPAYKFISEE